MAKASSAKLALRGLLVVLALPLIVACSSSSKEPTATPVPPTPTRPPTPSPTPVLVFTGDALKAFDYLKAFNTMSNVFLAEYTGTGTAVFITNDQAVIARLTDRGIALAEHYLRDVTALAPPVEIPDLVEVRVLAIRSAERVVKLSYDFKVALAKSDTAESARIAQQLVAYQSSPDVRRASLLTAQTLAKYNIPPGAVDFRPTQ